MILAEDVVDGASTIKQSTSSTIFLVSARGIRVVFRSVPTIAAWGRASARFRRHPQERGPAIEGNLKALRRCTKADLCKVLVILEILCHDHMRGIVGGGKILRAGFQLYKMSSTSLFVCLYFTKGFFMMGKWNGDCCGSFGIKAVTMDRNQESEQLARHLSLSARIHNKGA